MESFSNAIDSIFGPALRALFRPTNALFEGISPETTAILAKASSIGLFVCAILWVFMLKKEYVNLDAPGRKPWHDLRFWTIVAMLPHIAIYFWF